MQSNSAIHRILEILLLFQHGQEKHSIDDISTALQLPKSTTYRLVRILQENSLLEKSGNGQYQLGVAFMRLGSVALNSNRDLRLMALPSMKRIAESVRESVSLMRIMNGQVVCIESVEGDHALRVSIEHGRTQPLHAGASSRLLLAYLPENEWEDLLEFPLKRFSPNTMTDYEALKQNLYRIREQGFAVSDGEIDIGARAVAVPLYNNQNRITAALSIEAPAMRMPDEIIHSYLQLLNEEAQRIRNT